VPRARQFPSDVPMTRGGVGTPPHRPTGLRAALALVLALACPVGMGMAQPASNLAQREAVQHERDVLRERIERIEREMAEAEKARATAADELKASERAISETTRRLSEIEGRRKTAGDELKDLEHRISRRESDLAARQKTLAALMRQQYETGGVTPWSALLSGNDPQETGRTLGYLGYVSRARAAQVVAVREEIAALQTLHESAAERRAELDALAKEQTAQREERVRQQAERKRVLAAVGERLAVQRSEASRLADDETRLSGLITQINRELERQAAEARQRAEAEARRAREEAQARAREEARQRTEAAAQARAREAVRMAEERERQAAARAAAEAAARAAAPEPPADPSSARSTFQERGAQPVPSIPVPSAPPPVAQAPVMPEPVTPEPAPVPEPVAPPVAAPASVARSEALPGPTRGNFASLRGKLRLPARGDITGRFGEAREGGSAWRGVFIRAAEGTPVHAVATGTVVFSGWLRGFGNLLIVDHGNEYLTVYGNNQAILKQVGDNVTGGEAVASAGSSGGQAETGIYFELRHRGSPVDPLQWAALR